tara:strand:+ start:464 stop:1870 length:1407 start_codon:yes stop_codon:yes gene_type:complete
MTRILLVPNHSLIVFGGSIEQNSYSLFLENFLELMNNQRKDAFWYILIPKLRPNEKKLYKNIKKKLSSNNSLFISLDVPQYPQNQIHFNVNELRQKLKWRDYPIDIIFCHQLEITKHLNLFFKNDTNLNPPIVGYSHLMELPKLDWKGIFEYNIIGITEMVACFVNTNFQKQLIIEDARKIFSSSICGVLKEKLEVLPKVVIPSDIKPSKSGNYQKIIYWGDIAGRTKSFIEFRSSMEQLRKKRTDFKVWIPLLKSNHQFLKYDWVINNDSNNKRVFFKYLRNCCVGVSPKNQFHNWDKTIIQGIKSGVPFIIYDSDASRKLYSESTFYKSNKDLIPLLNKYLDDNQFRNLIIEKSIGDLISKYNFLKKVKVINRSFNKAIGKTKSIHNKKTKEIINLIKKHKAISHKDLLSPRYLDWDINVDFSGYRKAILSTGKIKEVEFSTKRMDSKKQRYPWKVKYKFQKLLSS